MTDVNGENNSVQMYQQLRELMNLREPFTLVTRLYSYPNMLITALSVPDDYTTMFALKAGIVFKQVRVVQVATIQVQQTVSGSKADAVNPTAQTQNQSSGKSASTSTSSSNKQSVLNQIAKASGLNFSKTYQTSKTTKTATTVSSTLKSKVEKLTTKGKSKLKKK